MKVKKYQKYEKCEQSLPPLQKCKIIPVGGTEDVDRVAALFGCKVGNCLLLI